MVMGKLGEALTNQGSAYFLAIYGKANQLAFEKLTAIEQARARAENCKPEPVTVDAEDLGNSLREVLEGELQQEGILTSVQGAELYNKAVLPLTLIQDRQETTDSTIERDPTKSQNEYYLNAVFTMLTGAVLKKYSPKEIEYTAVMDRIKEMIKENRSGDQTLREEQLCWNFMKVIDHKEKSLTDKIQELSKIVAEENYMSSSAKRTEKRFKNEVAELFKNQLKINKLLIFCENYQKYLRGEKRKLGGHDDPQFEELQTLLNDKLKILQVLTNSLQVHYKSDLDCLHEFKRLFDLSRETLAQREKPGSVGQAFIDSVRELFSHGFSAAMGVWKNRLHDITRSGLNEGIAQEFDPGSEAKPGPKT